MFGIFSLQIFYRKKERYLRLFLRLFLLMFLMVLNACGGGTDGNSGQFPQTAILASFTPDVDNPPSNHISISQDTVQDNLLTLRIMATSLSVAASGAAFDLEFDSNLVNFVGYSPGIFYEGNSSVVYQVALQKGSDNKLVVGITQQAGPGNTGSGALIELQFKAVGIGSSSLTFSNNNLTGPVTGEVIPGLTWSGGIVSGS